MKTDWFYWGAIAFIIACVTLVIFVLITSYVSCTGQGGVLVRGVFGLACIGGAP